jgi:hypothetical protein
MSSVTCIVPRARFKLSTQTFEAGVPYRLNAVVAQYCVSLAWADLVEDNPSAVDMTPHGKGFIDVLTNKQLQGSKLVETLSATAPGK